MREIQDRLAVNILREVLILEIVVAQNKSKEDSKRTFSLMRVYAREQRCPDSVAVVLGVRDVLFGARVCVLFCKAEVNDVDAMGR